MQISRKPASAQALRFRKRVRALLSRLVAGGNAEAGLWCNVHGLGAPCRECLAERLARMLAREPARQHRAHRREYLRRRTF